MNIKNGKKLNTEILRVSDWTSCHAFERRYENRTMNRAWQQAMP